MDIRVFGNYPLFQPASYCGLVYLEMFCDICNRDKGATHFFGLLTESVYDESEFKPFGSLSGFSSRVLTYVLLVKALVK